MAPAGMLTESVCPKGPVAALEKPPVDEVADREIEMPPVGAGELRSSAIGVDGWPATRVCDGVANPSVALRVP